MCCKVSPCSSGELKKHLEDTLTESCLKERFTDEFLSEHVCLSYTEKLRRVCYQETSSYFHRNKWYPQDCEEIKYTALPSCIVWTIRRHFEESNGKYTGFPPKPELLQKVVDARHTFRSTVDGYKAVIDVTNPDNGLFTMLRKLDAENQLQAVYRILLRKASETSTTPDCEERWTESTNKGLELLPRLVFVACATAFEVFVHDAVRCCFETVFPTTKVSESDKEYWMSELESWLKSRIDESEVWRPKEHESETNFWAGLPFDIKFDVRKTETPNPNPTLLKIRVQDVFMYVIKNPMSQETVGLVQEMVDNRKQNIMGIRRGKPTMQNIQEAFTKLVSEAPHNRGKRKFRGKSSTRKLKKQKTKRVSETSKKTENSSLHSSSSSSMTTSMSNVSSDIVESSCSVSTAPTPESSKAELSMPVGTSTPSQVPASAGRLSRQTGASPETSTESVSAIEYLITHYAAKYNWQIYLRGAPHDVNCADTDTLSYLSKLFYGMRCIFSHGSPQQTVDFGALRVVPQESSDLNINIICHDKTEEERIETKNDCEAYLLKIAKDAKEKISQMTVDHDLFLTVQSFYAYLVEIIGGVAECVAYKCSDVKLRTKAAKSKMDEIQEVVDDAWGKSADKKVAPSPIVHTSSASMEITAEPQTDDPSVHGAEQQTTAAGASTGVTQEFLDFL